MYQRQQHSNVIPQKSVNSCTNKKSEKKQNKKTTRGGSKREKKREKKRENSLVLFGGLSCVCELSSQPQKREFFQIKRVHKINLARRKKFFSSSLLSGAERERERKQNNTLVRIKEGEKTRRENPPSILLLCFLASSFCDARKSNC